MSAAVEHVAWVSRVLGVEVPRRAAESTGAEGRTSRPEPFEVFVKSVDNMTLTLRLPDGPATTLGDLRKLVEGRSGLSLDEHSLMIGAKQFSAGHADLTVADYGMHRNQTLFLNGPLKGGFGERAAMADTILRGIVHGNVLGEIEASDGASKAKLGFGRALRDPRTELGREFRKALFEKVSKEALLPDGVTSESDFQDWMEANRPFVAATTHSHLQAGNCSEYANVAYTSLITNTQNQTVYRAEMKDGFDHVFVITSPTEYQEGQDDDKRIEALYNDPDAMVVDPWWKSTICTFKDFVDGRNPYAT